MAIGLRAIGLRALVILLNPFPLLKPKKQSVSAGSSGKCFYSYGFNTRGQGLLCAWEWYEALKKDAMSVCGLPGVETLRSGLGFRV